MKLSTLLEDTIKYDRLVTQKMATEIMKSLNVKFHGYFDMKTNNDSSITFMQNGGSQQHDANNGYVLSPQNLSKVLDPYMRPFREKGWTFTQPVNREFTIGVPTER